MICLFCEAGRVGRQQQLASPARRVQLASTDVQLWVAGEPGEPRAIAGHGTGPGAGPPGGGCHQGSRGLAHCRYCHFAAKMRTGDSLNNVVVLPYEIQDVVILLLFCGLLSVSPMFGNCNFAHLERFSIGSKNYFLDCGSC